MWRRRAKYDKGVLRSLSQSEFEKEFAPLHESIFAEYVLEGRPFVSTEWIIALLPYGSNMDERDFLGMLLGAKVCGDQELIISDAESIQPSVAAIVIEPSYDAFKGMGYRPKTDLHILDSHLFGRSGRWGCACLASLDDIAVVGGDSSFMERFVGAVGGLDALRDRFMTFADKEWVVRGDVRARLLRTVGW